MARQDPVDAFERIAEAFLRETGFMRPGKSIPLEMSNVHSDDMRALAWEAWVRRKQDEVCEKLAVALAKAEGSK